MAKDDAVYQGPKTACDNCGSIFSDSALVVVCTEKDKVFCARGDTATEQAICAIIWARKNGATDDKPFTMRCMKYQGGGA